MQTAVSFNLATLLHLLKPGLHNTSASYLSSCTGQPSSVFQYFVSSPLFCCFFLGQLRFSLHCHCSFFPLASSTGQPSSHQTSGRKRSSPVPSAPRVHSRSLNLVCSFDSCALTRANTARTRILATSKSSLTATRGVVNSLYLTKKNNYPEHQDGISRVDMDQHILGFDRNREIFIKRIQNYILL